MPNYIGDFQDATVGAGLATGWTAQWAAATWSVILEGSDKILSRASQASNVRTAASLNAVDADATRGDADVVFNVRVSSVPTQSIAGMVVRASGATGAETGYFCNLYGPDKLRIFKNIAGVSTTLSTTDIGPSHAANTFYWIRFRVVGSSLKAKYWGGLVTDEPVAWAAEITDSSITGVGWAGVYGFTAAVKFEWGQVAIATNGDTATFTADTTAPVLTSPTGTTASSSTADGTVTTDEANGTLYFLASTNATEVAATVITGGATGGTQAITSTGSKSVNVTGLTPSTAYYLHYVHVDAALNTSTRVSSAQFTTSSADVTPPTLSAPTATQTGATTANLGVTTNENNGILYVVATTSATPPSATQIRAGQNNAGTAAAFAANQAITTTGAKSFGATGLTSSTTYYTYFHHRDASNNDSSVSAASGFTTAASGTKGIRLNLYNVSTALANQTGLTVCWWDTTTPHTWGAPLYQTNAETTDATGMLEVNLAAYTTLAIASKGFLLVYKLNVGDTNASLVFAGQVAISDIA